MQKKSYETDFTTGKIIVPLFMFALPLMLSGMLQIFYNAADIIVVGRFAGKESLAAVGSTTALINLLTNVLIGLSVGTNVLVAKGFGTNDNMLIKRSVHTAVTVALVGGVIFGTIGFIFAKPLLTLMDSPEDVIGKSTLYMKIYFIGLPATAVYNFGSAILRAVGDTKRPLFFLIISGFVNIILNLVFVIVFKMDVAGVACATVISQITSAAMVVICLVKTDSAYKLIIKEMKIHKNELISMLRIGLPAGLQGSLFSLSNILIQSSINSFGSVAMAGNSAGGNIEGFAYTAMNSVYHTALTYFAQNLGVKNMDRIKKRYSLLYFACECDWIGFREHYCFVFSSACFDILLGSGCYKNRHGKIIDNMLAVFPLRHYGYSCRNIERLVIFAAADGYYSYRCMRFQNFMDKYNVSF